jgi:hypothetical protein
LFERLRRTPPKTRVKHSPHVHTLYLLFDYPIIREKSYIQKIAEHSQIYV